MRSKQAARGGSEPTPRPREARAMAVVAVAVVVLCWPLLVHDALPLGSDIFATCHYLQGFMKALGEGDLLPRWTDQTNQDLGAPSFVLFPPLTFYAAAGASWLTGSILSGLKLYQVLLAGATAVAFYGLARDLIGPGVPAAIATALYLLLPYHVLDMYQRFALSETTSFLFFPLVLLFARRLRDGRGRWAFLGLSLSYAGLVLTHLVSAFLFTLFLGLWLIWENRARPAALAPIGASLLLGLGLSAVVLLPAAVEKSDVNIAWVREMPNGDYRINFIFRDEVLPGLGFKDPVKPPVRKSALSQLLLAAVSFAMGIAWLSREDRKRRRDLCALAAACALAYFLQLEASTPVWRVVPELPTVQFPWRLQTIMVLSSALLAGFGLASATRQRLAGPGIVLLVIVAGINVALSWQNAHLKPFAYTEQMNRQPAVVRWIEPSLTPTAFEGYKSFRETRLDLPQVSFTQGKGEAKVSVWRTSHRVLELESDAGGTVQVRTFWFPGWTGALDGRPIPLGPSPRLGVLTFQAPAGRSTVELRFEATQVRRAAAIVSLASVLLTGLLVGWWPRFLTGRAGAIGREAAA